MEEKFYVYIYLDPRKPGNYCYDNLSFNFEPFYIGKGSGNRINVGLNDRNTFKSNITKAIYKEGLKPILLKIIENINERESFLLETELVLKIGRRDLKKGPLTNLTDGGEGTSNVTEEVRKKLRKAHLGKKLSVNAIESLRKRMIGNKYCLGKKQSEETKRKRGETTRKLYLEGDIIPWNWRKKYTEEEKKKFISFGFKGKNHSTETRNKLSEIQSGVSFEERVGKLKAAEWKSNMSRGIKEAFKNGLSDEHKEKIRIARSGWVPSEETRINMSKAKKGIKPWNYGKNKIIQKDLDGNFIKEWDSMHDIKKELNLPPSNICRCCQGSRNKVGGYKWEYKTK
jgi:hypothetical protein